MEVRTTREFGLWLSSLRDIRAMARINARIDRLALGNFGDTKQLGDGIGELRIDLGPGYRVYYTRRGQIVVILLCGGDKSSQARDIERAKSMAREV